MTERVTIRGPIAQALTLFAWYLVFPFLVIIGPLMMLDELYACWRMSETSHGHIIRSEYSARDRENTQFDITLVYEYQVGAQSFRGHHYGANWFLPGSLRTGQLSAWMTSHRYPAGTPVTVHYDPSAPQRSCMHRGLSCWSLAMTMICTSVALIFVHEKVMPLPTFMNGGYPFLGIAGGILMLLIGPWVYTLWSFLILCAILLVFSTPGWAMICRVFGWKPLPPLTLPAIWRRSKEVAVSPAPETEGQASV